MKITLHSVMSSNKNNNVNLPLANNNVGNLHGNCRVGLISFLAIFQFSFLFNVYGNLVWSFNEFVAWRSVHNHSNLLSSSCIININC